MYSTEQEKLITPFRAQRGQRKEHEQFMKILASCSLRTMHSVPKGALAGSREEVSHDIYEFLMEKLRSYEEKWKEWKRWGGEKPQFPFPRKWSVSWIATAYYNHLHSERSKEKNPYGYYKKAMRRAIGEKSRNSDTLFTDTADRWTHYSRRPITEKPVDYTRFMLEEQAGPLAGWPAPGGRCRRPVEVGLPGVAAGDRPWIPRRDRRQGSVRPAP